MRERGNVATAIVIVTPCILIGKWCRGRCQKSVDVAQVALEGLRLAVDLLATWLDHLGVDEEIWLEEGFVGRAFDCRSILLELVLVL